MDIRVPEVSDGVTNGTVIALSVAVGDHIEADQTLLEMETEKAVVAIPAPAACTITGIAVAEGDEVRIGDVIMTASTPEQVSSTGKPGPALPPDPAAEPAVPQEKKPSDEAKPAVPAQTSVSTQGEPGPGETIDLSTNRTGDLVAAAAPSVRRLARDLGVDIYQVQGTGPAGRISSQDVREFVRLTMQRITGGGSTPTVTGEFPGLHAQRPLPDFTKWGPVHTEPLAKVRRITADAMGYAWSTIPMVTQYDHGDITDLEAFRKDFNRQTDPAHKLTMTAILLKVCAAALRAFPRCNSSLDLAHQELIFKDHFHIGVAVDTPAGLLVPVVRDVDRKGIEALATELNELAARARRRRLGPAEMEGGTFTISNLGGIGGTAFSPIVYAPQVAILGVSQATMQPVWDGGDFHPRLVMPLSLTYDHRVIDGADGARFLRWICAALEQPLNLVMKG